MSTVRANAILDASGGNTATINSMTPTADSLQGFRNRIINGGMVIDQRNAGASVTPTNSSYGVDRWQYSLSQASKLTAQQSTTAPVGFTQSNLITSSSAYSVGASEVFLFRQRIEGFNVSDLGWGTANAKTVTLSFWVRSSLTGTFGGAIRNNAQDRSYPFSYTIIAANTFEYKTITIAGDTSGTWTTDNTTGVEVNFSVGAGSSISNTAGAWVAGSYASATGATSVVGTNGATFYITGVQFEVGSVATPFERRDYGRELIMCQRYFCKTFNIGTAPASGAGQAGAFFSNCGSSTASTAAYISTWYFPVSMRAAPTVTTFNPSTAGQTGWFDAAAANVAAAVSNAGTAGVLVYNSGTATTGRNACIHLTADIEL